MSTVQNVLDVLAYRLNTDNNLYPLINMAIRTIAKRLRIMRSSLVVGEMSVSVFAEVEYAASTIAFEETDPDTITDSASQFVTEGFQADMPITTDDDSNPGPFRITGVSAGALTIDGETGVLSEVAAGSEITITSDAEYGFLPADFWGLMEDKPYVDGTSRKWELDPLVNQQTKINYLSASEPRWFQIKGNRLYVTPATNSDIIIKADYFQKPSEIGDPDDTLPYDELFDDVIAESVVRLYSAGTQNEAGLTAFRLFLEEQVNLIASLRDFSTPKRMPVGIDWDAFE